MATAWRRRSTTGADLAYGKGNLFPFGCGSFLLGLDLVLLRPRLVWHTANPVRQRLASAINRQSFAAILSLVARFKAVHESQGLTLAEVALMRGVYSPRIYK